MTILNSFCLTDQMKLEKKKYIVVVNIQTSYEIFIYVEGGIPDPNFKAGWAKKISARL